MAHSTFLWLGVMPDGPNQRRGLDFVSDSLLCGRRLCILCVVDDYRRASLD